MDYFWVRNFDEDVKNTWLSSKAFDETELLLVLSLSGRCFERFVGLSSQSVGSFPIPFILVCSTLSDTRRRSQQNLAFLFPVYEDSIWTLLCFTWLIHISCKYMINLNNFLLGWRWWEARNYERKLQIFIYLKADYWHWSPNKGLRSEKWAEKRDTNLAKIAQLLNILGHS